MSVFRFVRGLGSLRAAAALVASDTRAVKHQLKDNTSQSDGFLWNAPCIGLAVWLVELGAEVGWLDSVSCPSTAGIRGPWCGRASVGEAGPAKAQHSCQPLEQL